jgi:hypothetical protein
MAGSNVLTRGRQLVHAGVCEATSREQSACSISMLAQTVVLVHDLVHVSQSQPLQLSLSLHRCTRASVEVLVTLTTLAVPALAPGGLHDRRLNVVVGPASKPALWNWMVGHTQYGQARKRAISNLLRAVRWANAALWQGHSAVSTETCACPLLQSSPTANAQWLSGQLQKSRVSDRLNVPLQPANRYGAGLLSLRPSCRACRGRSSGFQHKHYNVAAMCWLPRTPPHANTDTREHALAAVTHLLSSSVLMQKVPRLSTSARWSTTPSTPFCCSSAMVADSLQTSRQPRPVTTSTGIDLMATSVARPLITTSAPTKQS